METELNHLTANMAALESENNKLRAELATSNRCLFQMQEAAKVLSAELAGLRAQVPVAYMHNKRVDVIHTSVKSLLSDFAVNSGLESMLRPIDKQEHYTIPLYARPVPPAAVPDDVAKDAIGKIDQNSYTTGWNDCAQQIGDDRMPGIRYTAEYLRERVNTMRIKGLSMSVMMSPTIWQQRLRGSFRSPRPASVTPRCTIPSCSPPTPRAAKMRNRIAIIAISAAVLSGCGWFDRKLSALTGEASKVCVDGVTYLQFTSGATVQLDRAGLPVACN